MPKSLRHINAGNINMKGKKSRLLRCGCCDCIDFREKEKNKQHEKDIDEFIKTHAI
jgi:hypothetical protein